MKPLTRNPSLDDAGSTSETINGARTIGTLTRPEARAQRFGTCAVRRLAEAQNVIALKSAIGSIAMEQRLAAVVGWFTAGDARKGTTDGIDGLLTPADGISPILRQRLADLALDALRHGECSCQRLSADSAFQLVAVPIPNRPTDCLVAVSDDLRGPAGTAGDEPQTQLKIELLAAHAGSWFLKRTSDESALLARTTAELAELVTLVQSASDATVGSQRLADALQSHTAAAEAFVFLCWPDRKDGRLTAISGGRVISRLDQETRAIESVLQESVLRGTGAVWPASDLTNRHALLAHLQLIDDRPDTTLLSMPLIDDAGTAVGSVLLTFNDHEQPAVTHRPLASNEQFLRAASRPLATVFSVLNRQSNHRWLHGLTKLKQQLTASRLQTAGWIASIAAIVLLLPVTYTVKGTAELQPAERRFVAAPFAGPLDECLVEPGDIVRKDQLLATMDGREIRWELAEVEASLNKAIRERNTQTADREFGSASVTSQEVARLEQRRAMLQHRATSLEIRSPADGIVVSGDHREAEGVPLDAGQSLFEIAPLDRMVIEVGLPEGDVRHVVAGMTVTVQPDAIPERSLTATIRRIHPRAELRDGDNVFVAEADILNEDGILRPGMRGQARVSTERHPLGWNLFHKPVAWTLGWIGL